MLFFWSSIPILVLLFIFIIGFILYINSSIDFVILYWFQITTPTKVIILIIAAIFSLFIVALYCFVFAYFISSAFNILRRIFDVSYTNIEIGFYVYLLLSSIWFIIVCMSYWLSFLFPKAHSQFDRNYLVFSLPIVNLFSIGWCMKRFAISKIDKFNKQKQYYTKDLNNE